MKKIILFCLFLISISNCFSQVKESFPRGFRKANLPNTLRNSGTKIPVYQKKEVNNPNTQVPDPAPLITHSSSKTNLSSTEYIVGYTFFDIQTNNSINNCL